MSGTQIDRILSALQSGAWLTLPELHQQTGDPVASISAQLRHLRKPQHGAHNVVKRIRRGTDNLYEYTIDDGAGE